MISEYFVVLKKNRERVLSALIKNKYPDISESLKKNKEQTGGEQVMNCRGTVEKFKKCPARSIAFISYFLLK